MGLDGLGGSNPKESGSGVVSVVLTEHYDSER